MCGSNLSHKCGNIPRIQSIETSWKRGLLHWQLGYCKSQLMLDLTFNSPDKPTSTDCVFRFSEWMEAKTEQPQQRVRFHRYAYAGFHLWRSPSRRIPRKYCKLMDTITDCEWANLGANFFLLTFSCILIRTVPPIYRKANALIAFQICSFMNVNSFIHYSSKKQLGGRFRRAAGCRFDWKMH